jgi:hypothetical protein
VEKGIELDVEEKGSSLVISNGSSSKSKPSAAKIDISGMNASLVWNYVNAVYRAGFDEIEIFFSEPAKTNLKTGKSQKTIELIANITDKLVGMEIIKQTKNTCVLKQITKMDSEAYENVLNRIHLSLINIADDMMNAIVAKDLDTLDRIHKYSEVNVNKLSDYCLRILNLKSLESPLMSNNRYLMTFLLEEIGDAYADIARSICSSEKMPDQQIIEMIKDTNSMLELNYSLFLKPDKEKLMQFHEQRYRLKKKLDSLAEKQRSQVPFLLKNILNRMMEIDNCVTTADSYRAE